MRVFVITVALASLIIPAVMADPEPAQTQADIQQSGIQQSVFAPRTPTEAFRPSKDKDSISLNAVEAMDIRGADAR